MKGWHIEEPKLIVSVIGEDKDVEPFDKNEMNDFIQGLLEIAIKTGQLS